MIYDEMGLKTFINAAGTYTVIGGSRMSEKTLQDMAEAARHHVEIRELQKEVHKRLAKLTRNEAAYVSNGAACGIHLTIAACAALKEKKPFINIKKERRAELEVVVCRAHRNPYDAGIEDLGIKLVEIGYPNIILPANEDDMHHAINENTIAVFYVVGNEGGWIPKGELSFEKTQEITKEFNIPLIVDAAAQVPPVENLWNYTEAGADIALFSGGKDLRGPQASGLIVGKECIISAITELGFPNYSIGRKFKVGREEIVGLYSAVEQYVNQDHRARTSWCEEQIKILLDAFADSKLFLPERRYPNEAGQPIARGFIGLKKSANINGENLKNVLFDGEPSVYVTTENENGVYINPMTMIDNEMQIVVDRLREIEKQYSE